jgi:ligand-binding sensor domain-containing protein
VHTNHSHRILLAFILGIILRGGICQTPHTPLPMAFESFSVEQGLSQASGYAACQDSEGFMWLGTQDGLNLFDGYHFTTFRHTADSLHSISDNLINDVSLDKQGTLWVGTQHGISIKKKGGKYFEPLLWTKGWKVNYTYEAQDGYLWVLTFTHGLFRFSPDLKERRQWFAEGDWREKLIDIAESPTGDLWIAARNGFLHWSPQRQDFQTFTIPQLLFNGKSDMTIRRIGLDNDGSLWVGGLDNGLFIVDFKSKNPQFDTTKTPNWSVKQVKNSLNPINAPIAGNDITEIYRTSWGDMWIGTKSGLSIWRHALNRFDNYDHRDDDPLSISRNYIISVFEDRQKLMWVGVSGGGFCKYDPTRLRFSWLRRFANKENPKADNMVYNILETADKTLYFTTQTDGLIRFQNDRYKAFKNDPLKPESLLNNTCFGIANDGNGKLWIATYGGLSSFDVKTEKFWAFTPSKDDSTSRLLSIHKLKNRTELLVSGTNGVFRFDLKTEKWLKNKTPQPAPATIARRIFEDSEGQIWLGTEGKGLVLYDVDNQIFTSFQMPTSPSCRAIIESTDKQQLWVGTQGGLVLFDKKEKKVVKTWTTQEGLPNNVVYSLLLAKDGNLWIATNNGLTRMNTTDGQMRTFTTQDGLQSNEFNTNAAFQSPYDGRLYFGGINGISTFFSEQLIPNAYKPPVKITNFQVFNRDFPFEEGKTLELTNKQNFFTFHFVALNYSLTEKNEYAYQLVGVDNEWVNCGTQHSANYTNISAGDYTFRVKAANNDGLWSNKIAEIHLHIEPPYWQKFWFKLLLVTAISSIVFLIYLSREKQAKLRETLLRRELELTQKEAESQQKEANFRQKLGEVEMAALRSQMNPHFIFNVLNSINDYMLNHDAQSASQYLTDFSKLIRLVLENSRSEKVTLSNELAALELYMKFEQLRFEDKLRYAIEIDANIDTQFTKIPPLLIQPYIENAIWHGLMHRPKGGKVTLRLKEVDENLLHIEIEDDGIGRTAAAELKSKSAMRKKSFGMTITSERIQLVNEIFKTNTQVSIQDLINTEGEACGTKVVIEIPC